MLFRSATELLTAAAAWTEKPLIGTGILVGGYHRPVELAQRLAAIDILSNGRLIAGLSVGWSKDEHEQMDVEFHTRGRRMGELVDALLERHAGRFTEVISADLGHRSPVETQVADIGSLHAMIQGSMCRSNGSRTFFSMGVDRSICFGFQ